MNKGVRVCTEDLRIRRRRRIVVWLLAAWCAGVVVSPPAAAQKKTNSPVFKSYRPPDEIPFIRQPDAIYEMTQAFLVARRASTGDPVAQHELGIRYLWGRGVPADTMRAAYWIAKASEQNLGYARFNLGILTYNGWGVAWNPFEAYRQFRICAELGMHEAEFAVAQFLREDLVLPRDNVEALAWVRKAAEGGYQPAKDALPEFERAVQPAPSDSGSSTAMLLFPGVQDTGSRGNDRALLSSALEEASPELRKALGITELLKKDARVDSATMAGLTGAANAGSPEALAVLGRLEETNDPIAAAAFYVRAIRLESGQAGRMLLQLIEHPEFFPALRTRTDRGDSVAQFAWSVMAALGLEPQLAQHQAYITPAQVLSMLRASAGKEYVPALVELGLESFAGRLLPEDRAAALEFWRTASRRGSVEAEIRLAIMTLRGQPDSASAAAALSVVVRGVEAGSILADLALAYCYEKGIGVPVRMAVAAHYYRTAAARGSTDAFGALRRLIDGLRPRESQFQMPDD